MIRRHFLASVAMAAAMIGTSVAAQDKKFTIGVAIPSATHGFMGGLNFHAQDTIKRLEAPIRN